MVLQLEDCVDCVTVLYPKIDFIFLFDHSRGHDKQREDGLNVDNMGKYTVVIKANCGKQKTCQGRISGRFHGTT